MIKLGLNKILAIIALTSLCSTSYYAFDLRFLQVSSPVVSYGQAILNAFIVKITYLKNLIYSKLTAKIYDNIYLQKVYSLTLSKKFHKAETTYGLYLTGLTVTTGLVTGAGYAYYKLKNEQKPKHLQKLSTTLVSPKTVETSVSSTTQAETTTTNSNQVQPTQSQSAQVAPQAETTTTNSNQVQPTQSQSAQVAPQLDSTQVALTQKLQMASALTEQYVMHGSDSQTPEEAESPNPWSSQWGQLFNRKSELQETAKAGDQFSSQTAPSGAAMAPLRIQDRHLRQPKSVSRIRFNLDPQDVQEPILDKSGQFKLKIDVNALLPSTPGVLTVKPSPNKRYTFSIKSAGAHLVSTEEQDYLKLCLKPKKLAAFDKFSKTKPIFCQKHNVSLELILEPGKPQGITIKIKGESARFPNAVSFFCSIVKNWILIPGVSATHIAPKEHDGSHIITLFISIINQFLNFDLNQKVFKKISVATAHSTSGSTSDKKVRARHIAALSTASTGVQKFVRSTAEMQLEQVPTVKPKPILNTAPLRSALRGGGRSRSTMPNSSQSLPAVQPHLEQSTVQSASVTCSTQIDQDIDKLKIRTDQYLKTHGKFEKLKTLTSLLKRVPTKLRWYLENIFYKPYKIETTIQDTRGTMSSVMPSFDTLDSEVDKAEMMNQILNTKRADSITSKLLLLNMTEQSTVSNKKVIAWLSESGAIELVADSQSTQFTEKAYTQFMSTEHFVDPTPGGHARFAWQCKKISRTLFTSTVIDQSIIMQFTRLANADIDTIYKIYLEQNIFLLASVTSNFEILSEMYKQRISHLNSIPSWLYRETNKNLEKFNELLTAVQRLAINKMSTDGPGLRANYVSKTGLWPCTEHIDCILQVFNKLPQNWLTDNEWSEFLFVKQKVEALQSAIRYEQQTIDRCCQFYRPAYRDYQVVPKELMSYLKAHFQLLRDIVVKCNEDPQTMPEIPEKLLKVKEKLEDNVTKLISNTSGAEEQKKQTVLNSLIMLILNQTVQTHYVFKKAVRSQEMCECIQNQLIDRHNKSQFCQIPITSTSVQELQTRFKSHEFPEQCFALITTNVTADAREIPSRHLTVTMCVNQEAHKFSS